VNRVLLKDEAGDIIEIPAPKSIDRPEIAHSKDCVLHFHEWGHISAKYESQENALNISLNISNTSRYTIVGLELNVMTLVLPKKPVGFDYPHVSANIDGPTAVLADCGERTVACCNDDFFQPLRFGPAGAKRTDLAANILERSTARLCPSD